MRVLNYVSNDALIRAFQVLRYIELNMTGVFTCSIHMSLRVWPFPSTLPPPGKHPDSGLTQRPSHTRLYVSALYRVVVRTA